MLLFYITKPIFNVLQYINQYILLSDTTPQNRNHHLQYVNLILRRGNNNNRQFQ